jgi:hypothetical protein
MERQVVAKVVRRLVPFLILLSFLNYMDRVNVSFAKLHMNAALGFTAVCGVAGLLLCAAASSVPVKIAGLALAACGLWSALAPFWTMPTLFLTGSAAAAGIAVVNSLGNLGGGFLGPIFMGHLKETTHDYTWGLLVDAAALGAAAALVVSPWTRPRIHPEMATSGEHR